MKEPLKLPIEDLLRILEEALCILQDTHFPGVGIKRRPKMADHCKIRTNSEDWKIANQVVKENWIRWAVNTFMAYKAPGPDDIHSVCLQKGLNIAIKCPIKLFRGSSAMSHIPKL